jgi:hypothetical protein
LQIEFSCFAVSAWDTNAAIFDTSSNALGGQGNLFTPFTRFGDPAVDTMDFNRFVSIRDYSSLEGGELNLVRQLPMPPGRLTTAFLVGARAMKIREAFDYFSQQAAAPAPLGASNWVSTNTTNELWGVQIGGISRFYVDDGWWIDFAVKGAVFNNAATQQTLYANADRLGAVEFFDHGRSRDGTAYVGDLDLTLVYRWSPALATRIGYQVLWVNGLALASQNFAAPLDALTQGPAQILSDGTAIYHGIHAGLELAW